MNTFFMKAFSLQCDFCKKYLICYIKMYNKNQKSVLFVPSDGNSDGVD